MSETRMVRSGLTRHPLSQAWGDIPEDQFLELAEDIKKHGQKETVVVLNGSEVIDGWHRAQACQHADREIRVRDFPADKDPRAFVISKNAHRRNQTASQRAAAIVKCHDWQSTGRPKNSAPGADFSEPATSKQMADEVNVSVRTIEDAKTAEEAGLGNAVVSGEMSAKQAAKQARKTSTSIPLPEDNHDAGVAQKKTVLLLDGRRPTLDRALEEIQTLQDGYAGLWKEHRELTDELNTYRVGELGEDAMRIELEKQAALLRTVESQRDEFMEKAEGYRREVFALRKELGR